MFKLTKKIITHFKSTHFKRVGTGGTKELKDAQSECSKTPDWNITQVIRSIGNKCVMKPGF